MKKTIFFLTLLTLIVSSCTTKSKSKYELGSRNNKERFKSGYFETLATDDYPSTTIIRKNNLQIEIYETGIDTFSIKWEGLFKYKLKQINPKNNLDNQEYTMQIKEIGGFKYQFVGSMGKSNFEVNGTVIKVANLKDSLEFEKSLR